MENLFKTEPQIVFTQFLCKQKVKFYIPSYQRGYRWEKPQIECLLNDILSYDSEKDGNFYCLQPIVICYDKENKWWRLVDGQQRLTTLYLTIKILCPKKDVFSIEFERGSHFPKKIGEEIHQKDNDNNKDNDNTAENFYLTQACEIIRIWKENKEKGHPDNIKTLCDNISKKLGIIWYPIKQEQEFDFFMHLNSGKIHLTDAELVKALLLHDIHRGQNIEKTLTQTSMAEEWNRMETKLREPSFWHFIAGRTPIPDCAMDYLLEVHYKSLISDSKEFQNYPYPTFAWAESKLIGNGDNQETKDQNATTNLWNDLRRTFAIITGWYEDTQVYNLVGLLLTINKPKDKLVSLLKMMREKGMSKHSFIAQLWKSATIDSKIIPSEDRVSILADKIKDLEIYDYHFKKTYDKVFNLLTLINIAQYTIGGQKRRFEFERYNDVATPWNIEHISPQNPRDDDELLKYFDSAKKEVSDDFPEEIEVLRNLLTELKDLESANPFDNKIQQKQEKILKIREKVLPFTDEEVMKLGNLTLLHENPNKGIGNNFFFVKRKKLRAKQEQGHFIPQVTVNVFTKWYSKKPTSPLLWEGEDRTDYLHAIADMLKKTFEYINHNYPS